jgi:heme/copper-type cytochrome/quinol oxidase subunit 4
MAVVLTVVTFWVTAYRVPKRVVVLPIPKVALLARRFPLNVD